MRAYKLKMLMKNYCALQGVTVSSDSVPYGDWDVEHLLTATPDAQFRTTDETTVTITLSLGQNRTIAAYGLFGHNLSQAAKITTELLLDGNSIYSNTAFANDPINSPFYRPPFSTRPFGYSDGDELDVVLNHTAVFFNDYFADELRITINDPNNADGYLMLGYLYAGEAIVPKYNPPWGDQIGTDVSLKLSRNDGVLFSKYEDMGRTASVSLPWLTETEALRIEQGVQFCVSKNLPIFVSYYEGAGGKLQSNHEMLAKISDYEKPSQHTNGFFKSGLQLIESVL